MNKCGGRILKKNEGVAYVFYCSIEIVRALSNNVCTVLALKTMTALKRMACCLIKLRSCTDSFPSNDDHDTTNFF